MANLLKEAEVTLVRLKKNVDQESMNPSPLIKLTRVLVLCRMPIIGMPTWVYSWLRSKVVVIPRKKAEPGYKDHLNVRGKHCKIAQ